MEKQTKRNSNEICNISNSKKVFIGGLPNKVTKSELYDFLSSFGAVSDLFMPITKEGLNKGFAFASFLDSKSIKNLVLNEDKIILRAKTVS